MTIGIDASRANNPQRTGTEWYAFNLIQELKKLIPAEHEVLLYTREPLLPDLAELPPNWENRVLAWPPRRLWTQLRLSWEMLVRPPDLLFVPVHVMPIILPKRTATTLHDIAFIPFPAAYGFFERLYQRFSIRFALKRSDVLFSVSEFSKQEAKKYFGPKAERAIVTPLGYDDKKFHPVHDRAEIDGVLAKYGIVAPYFLFIGRLETKKNLGWLLVAFAWFKEGGKLPHKLVLAGKKGYGFEHEWQKRNIEWDDDVVQPGYVASEDIASLYAGAEAFVFPSMYEGFGLPLLEAFACGTPVIASQTTSLPEVGGEAVLYIDPEKPEEITAAMERIVSDQELRAALIAKGSERIKFFSWKKTAGATWVELERILRRN